MEAIVMTTHAKVRKQQRGIPKQVLDCLVQFGKASHDNRGGVVLYFDKRSKQRCLSVLGRDGYRKLEGHLDVYAVRGLDGVILTVGHRSKKLHRA